MASSRHVSDSESDSSDLPVDRMHTPVQKETTHGDQSLPQSVLSHRFRSPPRPQTGRSGSVLAVLLSPVKNPWEYQPFKGNTTVDTILKDFKGIDGVHRYTIEYEDGNQEDVSSVHYQRERTHPKFEYSSGLHEHCFTMVSCKYSFESLLLKRYVEYQPRWHAYSTASHGLHFGVWKGNNALLFNSTHIPLQSNMYSTVNNGRSNCLPPCSHLEGLIWNCEDRSSHRIQMGFPLYLALIFKL